MLPGFSALFGQEFSTDPEGSSLSGQMPSGQGTLMGSEVPQFTFIGATMLASKVKVGEEKGFPK